MTDSISNRQTAIAAVWIAVALAAVLLMYQRVLLVNRISLPKTPDVLADRAQEALAKLGYRDAPRATAAGLGLSLDYLRYVDATSTAADRWKDLATLRPESVVFWYRTSPRLLVPWSREAGVEGTNPPLNVSGMTLVVLDASGRLNEFHAVPEPFDASQPHEPTRWSTAFEAAALDRQSFTSVTPKWNPVGFADERAAWEGHPADRPDLTFRVDAAAYHGRIVFFVINGPWSHSARSAPVTESRFNATVEWLAGLIMPGLMVAGALLARHNVKLQRGDRVGAFRAASIIFVTSLLSWTLATTHIPDAGTEIARIFEGIAHGLLDAAILWLTYLGLEPYVRRTSPDSLIGWTRLINGRWNDPHVGRDVIIGVSAGLLMTLLFPLYYLLPPMFGRPEPIPVLPDLRSLMGVRHMLGWIILQFSNAISSAMLGTVGLACFVILFKRRALAVCAAILLFTPVAVSGMFNPGYPVLALVLGAAMIAILVAVVVRVGLLGAMATLATHFILLRAPLTMDLSHWWASVGMWNLVVVAALGFGACYVARSSRAPLPVRRYSWQGA